LDCKPQGIPLDILCEALDEASVARNQVIDEMYAAIARPREADEMSAFTPRYATLEMDQKFVGKLIGPQGSTIKNIEARLLPIRPRSRCELHSLRTFPVVTLHPRFPFNV
jgi:polyribonucleotide nucleotidyltransferase